MNADESAELVLFGLTPLEAAELFVAALAPSDILSVCDDTGVEEVEIPKTLQIIENRFYGVVVRANARVVEDFLVAASGSKGELLLNALDSVLARVFRCAWPRAATVAVLELARRDLELDLTEGEVQGAGDPLRNAIAHLN